jgi:hypothetical protein
MLASNHPGRSAGFGILFHFIPDVVWIFIEENETSAHALYGVEA